MTAPLPLSFPLQCRPATPEDYEWCARLMASSDPWITLGRDLLGCHEALRKPGRELFVARQSGQNVGFVLLNADGFAGSPYIASLGVPPDARGRGIGTALLDFAERHFAGRRHLFLLVSSFNKRAQKLYRRRGYMFIGELKGYVVPDHDEFIFCKKLGEFERPR